MCAKKDNYYEIIYWIEDIIDSCNTIDDINNTISVINNFSDKLLKDYSINPNTFDAFINRLYSKYNKKLIFILQDYEIIDYHIS